MNTAIQYAKALQALVQKNPSSSKDYIHNLRASLAKRGHEKLLPRILNEYEKLETHDQRMMNYKEMTPEMKRTSTLLELYKRLVATK